MKSTASFPWVNIPGLGKSWTMLKVSLSLYPNPFSVLLHSFGEFQHIYIRSLKLSYSSLMSCSFFSLFSVNFQLFLLLLNQVNSEKAMATHSSTLAWKIPWTEEPGKLQSRGSLGVRHDWTTSLSLSCIGEGNGNPLQYSCLENPRDGGVWWATIYGVAQSRTQLKWLSSSSGIFCMHAC